MAMSDIIADSLTRIRNAQNAGHDTVDVKVNGTIVEILKIMKAEGYIQNFTQFADGHKNSAKVELKYYKNNPVIRGIEKVSTPGRRIYKKSSEITLALNNIGINIFSTSSGLLTGKAAKMKNVGGEYLCRIW